MQPQPTIEVSGALSVGELARFQYFHTFRRIWWMVLGAALFLVLLVPLFVITVLANPESDWRPVLSNAWPFIVLLLFWTLFLPVVPYRQAKKQYGAQKYLREPITYTFTSEEVSGTGPSVSWKLAWDIFKVIRETKTLFVMYHAQNVAVVVPKRFFGSAAEMEQWRGMVQSHMLKQVVGPGIVGRWC